MRRKSASTSTLPYIKCINEIGNSRKEPISSASANNNHLKKVCHNIICSFLSFFFFLAHCAFVLFCVWLCLSTSHTHPSHRSAVQLLLLLYFFFSFYCATYYCAEIPIINQIHHHYHIILSFLGSASPPICLLRFFFFQYSSLPYSKKWSCLLFKQMLHCTARNGTNLYLLSYLIHTRRREAEAVKAAAAAVTWS